MKPTIYVNNERLEYAFCTSCGKWTYHVIRWSHRVKCAVLKCDRCGYMRD